MGAGVGILLVLLAVAAALGVGVVGACAEGACVEGAKVGVRVGALLGGGARDGAAVGRGIGYCNSNVRLPSPPVPYTSTLTEAPTALLTAPTTTGGRSPKLSEPPDLVMRPM